MKNPLDNLSNTTCEVNDDGNLECSGVKDSIKVEMDGEKPKSGTIVFSEGKIINSDLSFTYLGPGLYDENDKLVYSWDELVSKGIIVVEDIDGNTTITGSNQEELNGKLIIDKNIDVIGSEAFFQCSGLTSVEIPSSVTSIEDSAFSMSSLQNITIPNSVTNIEEYAFYGCDYLTDIYYGGTEAQWNAISSTAEVPEGATVYYAQ